MTKYWQANPNHFAEWGEKGGLPIPQVTMEEGRHLDVVGLLVDQDGKAIRDNNGVFILIGTITIQYGGAGRTPINAKERQLERELPASNPAWENIHNETNTANTVLGAIVFTDGSNWFVTSDPADVGAGTIGYLIDSGGGVIEADVGTHPNALTVSIVGGNVFVEP